MKNTVKIGLFGIGLDTYWPQFEGLLQRLEGYQAEIKARMETFGVKIIDAGLIDTPEKAQKAALYLKENDVEIVFLFISTYALSSTVLPIAQRLKTPIILLNLQPLPAADYEMLNAMSDRGRMTGEWLAHCQACSVPEIAGVFNRADIKYDIVTGYLADPEAWKEIEGWIEAAHVMGAMRDNRMGILGHYYPGMLDVYTDVTRQSLTFGTHVEIIEMCELKDLRDEAKEEEILSKMEEFNKTFIVVPECDEYELRRAAQTSVALDKLVCKHKLGSLTYYYEGAPGNEYENIVTSVIAGNTILTGKGVPVAGECEVKNVQAMKIMSEFGAGGSFSEFYAMDFNDDIVMLGHDGPAHYAIAEGKVKLVPLPLYHGKPGKGLSIQMSVKHGPVTILSVGEGKDGVFLLVAEAESVPGPTFQIGNTNSRYRFSIPAKQFMDKWSKAGPSHHSAIGVGHIANKIEKFASLLSIPIVRVC
jgi:L-arabinose isomerase